MKSQVPKQPITASNCELVVPGFGDRNLDISWSLEFGPWEFLRSRPFRQFDKAQFGQLLAGWQCLFCADIDDFHQFFVPQARSDLNDDLLKRAVGVAEHILQATVERADSRDIRL